ncbi:hypothetical protein BD310DRAFT_890160 [Dichomitus squalens]|uniref:Uncharacterized protein n=1 Tax=Dichomitus squalens TaxID=114155 RepID=A0A4Q9PG39_9APHY|nr:hypothetical protein BD310DRAFT_890160 [Dichomitus squalens]
MFNTIRVYALSRMNVMLAMGTCALSIIPTIANLVQNIKWIKAINLPPPFNCVANDTTPPGITIMCPILVRGSFILADSIVLAVTWHYTHKPYRAQRSLHVSPSKSFTSVMLYNGSLYFSVLAALNTLDLILSVLDLIQNGIGGNQSLAGNVADVISPILFSRFILNLHQVNREVAHEQDDTLSADIQFAIQSWSSHSLPPSLASFAQPVHVGSEGEDKDEDTKEIPESNFSVVEGTDVVPCVETGGAGAAFHDFQG